MRTRVGHLNQALEHLALGLFLYLILEVKEDAKETKEALQVPRLSRANRGGELLQGTSKGNG